MCVIFLSLSMMMNVPASKENRLDSLDEIRSFFEFLVEERQNRKAGAILSAPLHCKHRHTSSELREIA